LLAGASARISISGATAPAPSKGSQREIEMDLRPYGRQEGRLAKVWVGHVEDHDPNATAARIQFRQLSTWLQ
jgi:hypothetical protein